MADKDKNRLSLTIPSPDVAAPGSPSPSRPAPLTPQDIQKKLGSPSSIPLPLASPTMEHRRSRSRGESFNASQGRKRDESSDDSGQRRRGSAASKQQQRSPTLAGATSDSDDAANQQRDRDSSASPTRRSPNLATASGGPGTSITGAVMTAEPGALGLSAISEADDDRSVVTDDEGESEDLASSEDEGAPPSAAQQGKKRWGNVVNKLRGMAGLEERELQRDFKSGYLMKKGERRKNWKKRWFVLRGGQLAMYKNDKEYSLLRLLPLDTIHSCGPIELKRHPHSFGIVTPSRTYYVQATSANEVRDWCRALVAAKEELKASATVTSTEADSVETPPAVAPQNKAIPTVTARLASPALAEPRQLLPVQDTTITDSPDEYGVSAPAGGSSSARAIPIRSPASAVGVTASAPPVTSNNPATSAPMTMASSSLTSTTTASTQPSTPRTPFSPSGNISLLGTSISSAGTAATAATTTTAAGTTGGPASWATQSAMPRAPPNSLVPSSTLPATQQALAQAAAGRSAGTGGLSDEEARQWGEGVDESLRRVQASQTNLGDLDPSSAAALRAARGSSTSQETADRDYFDRQRGNSLNPPLSPGGGGGSSSEDEDGDEYYPQATTSGGDMNPNRVVLQGYLTKQGKRKNWRKRWFVLTSERLTYSRTHMDTKISRQIPLSRILDAVEHVPQVSTQGGQAVTAASQGSTRRPISGSGPLSPVMPSTQLDDSANAPGAANSGPTGRGSKNVKHCFKIITPKRTYLICATNEEEEIKWLAALQCLVARRQIGGTGTTTVSSASAKKAAEQHALLSAPDQADQPPSSPSQPTGGAGSRPPPSPRSTMPLSALTSTSNQGSSGATSSPGPPPHARQRSVTDAARAAVKEVERRFNPTTTSNAPVLKA